MNVEALTVFFLLHLLDILTTISGLKRGATEKNSLARFVLEKMGILGLYTFKMMLGGVMLIVAWTTGNINVIWAWNALMALVVAWNSYINWRLAGHGDRL